MKKKWIGALVIVCIIALIGCKIVSDPDPIAVESVTLNAEKFSLAPCETRKLTVTVKPENADDKTVKWSSSDTSVATIVDGTITAVKEGKATITAQAGGKKATCSVTVKVNPVAVESIMLNATTLTLAPGVTGKLTATVNPDNANDKSVKWSSSDTSVAMVGSDGTVLAIKKGTAAITAQAGDKTAICVITVNETAVVNPGSPVAVESVTLNATTLTIEPGKTSMLTATVAPDNADDKTVAWSSSDTVVATVDNNGTVTAVKKGTATITAQAGDKTAICVITVNETAVVNPGSPVAVESVTLNATTLTIEPGKTSMLTATVAPDNADDKTVAWSSSDTSVATVDNNGTVTAVKAGTASITARAGGKTATCIVTVNPILVETVTLDKTALTLTRGATGKLTANVTPGNADDKSVAWSSSDTAIATVSNDGTVTAVKAGKTTITAQAGGKTAKCTVTVNPIAVASITLDATTLTLTRGETGKLTANVTPSNADDKTVAWSSSDASVATVDNNGTVTAVKVGTAKITARAGGKEATCAVTVNPISVASIMLDKNALTLETNMTGKLTATVTPSNADDTTVTWSSSNTTIATVDNSGTVTAVRKGTATIIAQAGGKTAECTLTVRTDHSWSGGKCTLCGAKPSMKYGTIDENGVLTKYTGSVATVTIPEGVTGIGNGAFKDCTSLKSVTIPDSVTSIEDDAFYGCTGLTSVMIPDSVMGIGQQAFYGCTGLTSVTIPGSVTSIGSAAFYKCAGLTEVWIKDGVTSIGEAAFAICENLKGVTIPGSVMNIERSAFAQCMGLTWVTMYTGVTSIGEWAFYKCAKLENVYIPFSVTSIESYAFYLCSNLKTVTYNGTNEQWDNIAIGADSGLSSVTIKFQNF